MYCSKNTPALRLTDWHITYIKSIVNLLKYLRVNHLRTHKEDQCLKPSSDIIKDWRLFHFSCYSFLLKLSELCGCTYPWRCRVRGEAVVASWLCCLSLERGCWDVGWGWDACFTAGVLTWTQKFRNTTSKHVLSTGPRYKLTDTKSIFCPAFHQNLFH